MFLKKENSLFTSDWHLFHKNIWIHEYEKRNKFLKEWKLSLKEIKDKFSILSLEDRIKFQLEGEYKLLKDVFINLKKILKENKNITEIFNFWDFLFEANPTKFENYKLTKNYRLLKEIFNFLKTKKIKNVLILWNHDNKKVLDYYLKLFDEVIPYLYDEKTKTLYSHYPYSDYKNYWISYKNIKKNYHWHTHSNEANEKKEYKKIEYINVCLDNFLMNQKK